MERLFCPVCGVSWRVKKGRKRMPCGHSVKSAWRVTLNRDGNLVEITIKKGKAEMHAAGREPREIAEAAWSASEVFGDSKSVALVAVLDALAVSLGGLSSETAWWRRCLRCAHHLWVRPNHSVPVVCEVNAEPKPNCPKFERVVPMKEANVSKEILENAIEGMFGGPRSLGLAPPTLGVE